MWIIWGYSDCIKIGINEPCDQLTIQWLCGFLLLLHVDTGIHHSPEMVVQLFFSSVLESVKTTLPVWQLLSTALLFTLFSLPLPLWIKERVGRGEKFNFPSFWPHSCSALSPSDRATWYHEKMFLYHNCNCFTAERLLTQIEKHLATFQWSVPSGSAKGWLKKGIGGDGRK